MPRGRFFVSLILLAFLAAPWCAGGVDAFGDPPGATSLPAGGPAATTSKAGDEDESSLARLLRQTLKRRHVPAIAAAVVRSSGAVDAAAVGVRKIGSKQAVTVDDCFHLGSCTKSMTASMCAMLVEQGKLKWETTVADAWPDLSAKVDEGFRKVTLEQLLCHRGGLPEDRRPDPAIWPKVVGLTGPLPQQRLAVVELVMGREPAYPPGSRFEYANFGVTIAGAMAEAATGEQYETLMRRLLFEPLGMTTAGFGPPGDAEAVDPPCGHTSFLESYQPVAPGLKADNPQVIAPAGTAHMSITDWGKYAAWHLRGARGDASLISKATFERIHRDPFGSEYGFGWGVLKKEGVRGPVLTHSGSNGMWFSMIWLAPEEDVGFVVAVNAGDERAIEACRAVVKSLIRRHIPRR